MDMISLPVVGRKPTNQSRRCLWKPFWVPSWELMAHFLPGGTEFFSLGVLTFGGRIPNCFKRNVQKVICCALGFFSFTCLKENHQPGFQSIWSKVARTSLNLDHTGEFPSIYPESSKLKFQSLVQKTLKFVGLNYAIFLRFFKYVNCLSAELLMSTLIDSSCPGVQIRVFPSLSWRSNLGPYAGKVMHNSA